MSNPTLISTESYTFFSWNNFHLPTNVYSLALGYVKCISYLLYCHAQISWGYVVTFSPHHMWLYCHDGVTVLDNWAGYGLLFLRKEYWCNFVNGAVCGNKIEVQPIRC
jgi:hypothetical protein